VSSGARPLRICFVAYRGNMRCGGQGVYLWFLVRELARLGHHVDVLVGPPYPDEMPFAKSVTQLPNEQFWGGWFARDRAGMLPRPDPLRIFEPLNFYELATSWLGLLPEPFAFSVRALRQIATRAKLGIHYDIVHDVQCLGWGDLGLMAMGLPVVTTVHHPLTVDRRFSFVRDEGFRDALGTMTFYPIGMQAFVARRVQRLFTSSAESARTIQADFGVRSERIRMVANGVDTDLFSPDPAASRNPRELLCVGRASDPNKGLVTLIDALPHLPGDVFLTLVDDPHPDNVARRRAEALGLGERVRIAGRVPTEELVTLYRRAALVVVPSRYEGFGLPAAEAMACGTPVVACAAGALPEVVETGGGGVLVPPANPEALADAIARLLEQPEHRAELGARGRLGVEKAYAWPQVAEATAEVYAEVVAARRGRPQRTTTSARAGSTRATRSKVSSVARAAN
jgi:glycosyltransferase involved in cell wall biosynthesis